MARLFDVNGQQIVSIILRIDPSFIDEGKSSVKLYDKQNMVSISLFSKDDERCPIVLALGVRSNAGRLHFTYDSNGPVLEVLIENNAELQTALEAVQEHLESVVEEESTFVGDKVASVQRSCYLSVEGKTERFSFKHNHRMRWPWEKTRTVRRTYKPWLVTAPPA